MNWNSILNLKAWSPLSAFNSKVTHYKENVFQVTDNVYLHTSPTDQFYSNKTYAEPFITLAYWVFNQDCLQRCVFMDDIEITLPQPTQVPRDLTLGTDGSYDKLLSTNEVKSLGKVTERASYNGVTGKFLYKCIDSTRFTYCFLKLDHDPQERPFAIQIRLSN